MIVGAEASEPARFAERVVEERGATLAPSRVRALLAGRVAESEIEERANQLLAGAVLVTVRLSRGVGPQRPLAGRSIKELEKDTRWLKSGL